MFTSWEILLIAAILTISIDNIDCQKIKKMDVLYLIINKIDGRAVAKYQGEKVDFLKCLYEIFEFGEDITQSRNARVCSTKILHGTPGDPATEPYTDTFMRYQSSSPPTADICENDESKENSMNQILAKLRDVVTDFRDYVSLLTIVFTDGVISETDLTEKATFFRDPPNLLFVVYTETPILPVNILNLTLKNESRVMKFSLCDQTFKLNFAKTLCEPLHDTDLVQEKCKLNENKECKKIESKYPIVKDADTVCPMVFREHWERKCGSWECDETTTAKYSAGLIAIMVVLAVALAVLLGLVAYIVFYFRRQNAKNQKSRESEQNLEIVENDQSKITGGSRMVRNSPVSRARAVSAILPSGTPSYSTGRRDTRSRRRSRPVPESYSPRSRAPRRGESYSPRRRESESRAPRPRESYSPRRMPESRAPRPRESYSPRTYDPRSTRPDRRESPRRR